MTPVGQYGNRLTRKIVAFIAEKTGRAQQYNSGAGEADFAENLVKAQRDMDNTSGESEAAQPDDTEAKPTEEQLERTEDD